MTIVHEVLDAIDTVAKGIANVRKIVEAVREGKQYLEQKHPEVKGHVAAMLEEMRKTMSVVREASSVLTGFWFTAGSASSVERFNELYRLNLARADDLKAHVDDLRGHCSKIREAAGEIQIDLGTGGSVFNKVARLFGLASPAREAEVAEMLDQLAYEDFAVARTANVIVDALLRSLEAVQEALGQNRVMDTDAIREAGRLLGEHAAAFEPLEEASRKAVVETKKLAEGLA